MGGSVAACAAAVPPPRCRSLCCRLMASALFGMRAAPSRRNGGPRPSSALPLNRARRPRFADGGVRWGQKPARPLRGSAAPPLCPCCAVSRGSGAPLRSGPAPRFWPRGGAILFSLRRVWGLRRLRAALKVYRTAHAAQPGTVYMASPWIFCDLLRLATAPYYREARVTFPRRQTACRMRHCCARRIDECRGRRKLVCTTTRQAEWQRIVEAKASRLAALNAATPRYGQCNRQASHLFELLACNGGVKGQSPLRSLGGVRGIFSHVREYPP